jgi:hypothetical protein
MLQWMRNWYLSRCQWQELAEAMRKGAAVVHEVRYDRGTVCRAMSCVLWNDEVDLPQARLHACSPKPADAKVRYLLPQRGRDREYGALAGTTWASKHGALANKKRGAWRGCTEGSVQVARRQVTVDNKEMTKKRGQS